MQNLYQLVKYSLINSQNWIQVMSDITLLVNMAHLTVEDQLLITTSLTEQAARLSQRDRAAWCIIVLAKSGRLELGDNILQTL